ncbi:hypothetical protein IE077_004021, partial [Cardiosporidium cionae]
METFGKDSPSSIPRDSWISMLLPLRDALRKVSNLSNDTSTTFPLLRRVYYHSISNIYKPTVLFSTSTRSGGELSEAVYKVIQALYALLVGSDQRIPSKYYILGSAVIRELCYDDIPIFFRENMRGNFSEYSLQTLPLFLSLLTDLSHKELLLKNANNLVRWIQSGLLQLPSATVESLFFLLKTPSSSSSHSHPKGGSTAVDTTAVFLPFKKCGEMHPHLCEIFSLMDSMAERSPEDTFFRMQQLFHVCKISLSLLVAISYNYPASLSYSSHIAPVEFTFHQLLLEATLEDVHTQSMIFPLWPRFFKTSSLKFVTELDGSPCREFFTVLNIGEGFSFDQQLNVQVFSSLYTWIFSLYRSQLFACRRNQIRLELLSKLSHYKLESLLNASTSKQISKNDSMKDSSSQNAIYFVDSSPLLNISFCKIIATYCFRLLEQIDRDAFNMEPGKSTTLVGKFFVGFIKNFINETEWQMDFIESVAVEAIRLLDLLCIIDPSFILSSIKAIKKVYVRLFERQGGLVLTTIVQFFYNHGHHVMMAWTPVLHNFFVDYINTHYRNALISMNLYIFLRNNISKLVQSSNTLHRYFPSILKLLAFHPRILVVEFLPILPSMVKLETLIEFVHSILDLPLTSLFLSIVRKYIKKEFFYEKKMYSGGPCIWEEDRNYLSSGLNCFYKIFPSYPRVLAMCSTVTLILETTFHCLPSDITDATIESLFDLIFKRFTLLYPVESYLTSIQSIFIDTLLSLGHRWPKLLLSSHSRLHQAIELNLTKEGFSLVEHLCWSFGEYSTPNLFEEDVMNLEGLMILLETLIQKFLFEEEFTSSLPSSFSVTFPSSKNDFSTPSSPPSEIQNNIFFSGKEILPFVQEASSVTLSSLPNEESLFSENFVSSSSFLSSYMPLPPSATSPLVPSFIGKEKYSEKSFFSSFPSRFVCIIVMSLCKLVFSFVSFDFFVIITLCDAHQWPWVIERCHHGLSLFDNAAIAASLCYTGDPDAS